MTGRGLKSMKCINSKREGPANWVHAHLGSTQLPLSVSVPAVCERGNSFVGQAGGEAVCL